MERIRKSVTMKVTVKDKDVELPNINPVTPKPCYFKTMKRPKVKPKKNVIKPPTLSQILFRRRNIPNSQYYYTSGRRVPDDQIRDVLNEQRPYLVPQGTAMLSFEELFKSWDRKQRMEDLNLNCTERNNYSTRQTGDISKRLCIPDSPNQDKTILDVDPDFYSIVEGRPIRPKNNIKDYISDVKKCCTTRLRISYLKDEILRIDENFLEEEKQYNKMCKLYTKYVDSFEKYLSDDHKNSMAMLKESDKQTCNVLDKDTELKELLVYLGKLRCTVHIMEEKCRSLKLYQNFLYEVSPLNWRLENDYIHGLRITVEDNEVSDAEIKRSRAKPRAESNCSNEIENLPLDDLIQKFKENVSNEDPKLYFTNSIQLMQILRMMELQNLNSLLHSEDMAAPLQQIHECMQLAKSQVEHEYKTMGDEIKDLMRDIEWVEKQDKSFESKIMQIIYGSFFKLYASEEILKLELNVENVYEVAIAQNDSNMRIIDMMTSLENLYESLTRKLDKLDYNVVKSVQKEVYKEDLHVMRVANEASRDLRNFKRLTERLFKSIEPPFQKNKLPLFFRSNMEKHNKKQPASAKRTTLNPQELEYLALFTDWCDREDPTTQLKDADKIYEI